VNQTNREVNQMKNRSWRDQKDYLCKLIKQISDYYAGDEIEWLRDYSSLIINQNKDDFSKAIVCFEELLEQTKYIKM
jgi:hypothetical protein